MKPYHYRTLAIALILVCTIPAGCGKKNDAAKSATTPQSPQSPQPPQTAAAAPNATATLTPGSTSSGPEGPPDWLANPQVAPGTISLTAVDPKDMSPSEKLYGRAPKLSPDVDYQPGVIIMEEGDKAIKAVASDGITWTFDANAPHVSDFAVGKIVFATGRAVGKILGMTRNGNDVSLYLGPIMLTDVIQRGRFVVDQPIDPDKIISYVAPDFPGSNDTTGLLTAMHDGSRQRTNETVVISTASHGKWIPTSMSSTDARGRRSTWRRRDGNWVLASARGMMQQLPGVPYVLPGDYRKLPPLEIPPTKSVNVDNGNVRVDAVANKSYLGVQYYYVEPKSGLGAYAGGLVTMDAPTVRAVLKFSKAGIDSAGISIVGAAGVKIRLDSHSSTEKNINMHLHKLVPLDMSIQLGGPLPFSLTFAMLFDINSGFSAKTSIMVAEGEYKFSGGIWAGRAGGQWSLSAPHNVTPVTNLGQSVAGISLGITSFTMAFGIRTTVGIGAFGFNTGVFAQVRFGGGLLKSATETSACRQASIDTYLDTGLGWSIPRWAATVINLFLKAVSANPIDEAGTLAKGPSARMFTAFDQIPAGCSSPKEGT